MRLVSADDNGRAIERLRPGSTALSREEVDGFQRARIVSAMVEVVAELGYIGAAVAPVVARAGVSRRTFYELFDGREDCFLAAFEWGAEQAREVALAAYRSQRSWRERVRYALAALLAFFDAEPELARVLVIEALGAGKLALASRAQLLNELIAALDAQAPPARGTGHEALLRAEGVVGGAFSVIHGRMFEWGVADEMQTRRGYGEPPLLRLHGQLMALIVLPYLGPRAAGEELTRPAPETPPRGAVPARGHGAGRRLLERLDMRLTYRTLRCLVFIGEHPGSSNREVAKGADVPDEGQASKLLARLVKLDLIDNGRPPGPGFPNHWTLTAHGEQVLSAVRMH